MEIEMDRDATLIYVDSNTQSQVVSILTNPTYATEWLNHCCLQPDVSKTTSMSFTKKASKTAEPSIIVLG